MIVIYIGYYYAGNPMLDKYKVIIVIYMGYYHAGNSVLDKYTVIIVRFYEQVTWDIIVQNWGISWQWGSV